MAEGRDGAADGTIALTRGNGDLVLETGLGSALERLDRARLGYVKMANTTRRVPSSSLSALVRDGVAPQAGDLVLAKVIEIGQHQQLELQDGRKAQLFLNDEVLVCYGNRYAPDQFEATVPAGLAECYLVAAGGIASEMRSKSSAVATPTRVAPLGLVADGTSRPVNLRDYRLHPRPLARRTLTIAVVGSSMNAGKTTVAAGIIRGFVAAGRATGAAKVTGTGAGRDSWHLYDAGARPVLDMVDAGYASTYLIDEAAIEDTFMTLVSNAAEEPAEVLVLELADGLLQRETALLLRSEAFRSHVDAIVFASREAMSAANSVDWLAREDLQVLAVSGVVTSSPLSSREAAAATGLPVLSPRELANPSVIEDLFARVPDGLRAR